MGPNTDVRFVGDWGSGIALFSAALYFKRDLMFPYPNNFIIVISLGDFKTIKIIQKFPSTS